MATTDPAQRVATREVRPSEPGRARANPLRDRGLLGCAALVVGALCLHAYNLGHPSLAPWDEVVHAIVAEHLSLHPLVPTLYQVGAFSTLPSDWSQIHIWLHVPPLGMLISALSMRLFGMNTLALRLPDLLLLALSMITTYVLGKKLFGTVPGLVGAAVIGFSPFLVLLTQGYIFGDITDVPLLLLTPLVLLGVVVTYRSGQLRWAALGGIALGFAYWSKGALALAPAVVPLVLLGAERLWPAEDGWRRLGWRPPAAFFAAALAVVAPYVVYTQLAFPAAAALEATAWKAALFQGIELWGNPMDYHLTVYLYVLYGTGSALLVLASLVSVTTLALMRRSRADLVIAAAILGSYLPLAVAATKVIGMGVPDVPLIGLAIGRTIYVGFTAPRHTLLWRAATTGSLLAGAAAALLAQSGLLFPIAPSIALQYDSSIPIHYYWWQYPLHERIEPYLVEMAFAVAAGAACWALFTTLRRTSRPDALLTAVTAALTVAAVLALAIAWTHDDQRALYKPNASDTLAQQLGTFVAAHAPANATVIYLTAAPQLSNMDLMVMFWAHRDVYLSTRRNVPPACLAVAQASRVGSPLYVLTQRPFTGHKIAATDGWTLYQPACG